MVKCNMDSGSDDRADLESRRLVDIHQLDFVQKVMAGEVRQMSGDLCILRNKFSIISCESKKRVFKLANSG